MKKSFFLLPALAMTFSSCSIVNLVKESTEAIQANRKAVEESTDAIRRNHDAVEQSNIAIQHNIEAVERSNAAIEENRRKLEEINNYVEKLGSWFSFNREESPPPKTEG